MKITFDINKLSEDLSVIRKERKKAVRVSAREMNLPHATIFRIERGEHIDIHMKTFSKICSWMGQSPINYFKFVTK